MHFDWFGKWALYHPEKVAFKEFETNRQYTYSQINNLANATAQWFLAEKKLAVGDRIAVLAENNLEYIVLFSVAQKTGLTLVPLNYRLAPSELHFMVQNSNPALLFYEEKFKDKAENIKAKFGADFCIPLEELQHHEKARGR